MLVSWGLKGAHTYRLHQAFHGGDFNIKASNTPSVSFLTHRSTAREGREAMTAEPTRLP